MCDRGCVGGGWSAEHSNGVRSECWLVAEWSWCCVDGGDSRVEEGGQSE